MTKYKTQPRKTPRKIKTREFKAGMVNYNPLKD